MAVRTFVFDLDGVVYRGEQPIPGAVDTIQTLRHLGHQVYFLTNNSTQTRSTYAAKLQRMGVDVDDAHIMTSSYATALYLSEHGAQGKSVLVVGEEGIVTEMKAIGMRITHRGSRVEGRGADEDCRFDYVVVGMDREFCYQSLLEAQQAILSGAKFIATNRDSTYPLEGGRVVPGGGSIVAAIEVASGVRPLLIGKPETYAMTEVLKLSGAMTEDCVVVGDRLDTDILAGKRAGMKTVLVLTGVTSEAEAGNAPEEVQPDVVIHSLPELLEWIR